MTRFSHCVGVWSLCFLANFSSLLAQTLVKGVRGGKVTLTCVAPRAVVAHPTILWEKTKNKVSQSIAASVSGIPHVSEISLKDRVVLNGGNLTISSLLIADSGKYTCTVTAIQSSPLSSSIKLVVTATPRVRVRVNPNPRLDSNGTYVAATCVADAGKPRPILRWTDSDDQDKTTRESESLHEDGSWSVRSELLLYPGLLSRPANSTKPVSLQEKMQLFTCHVIHENLKPDQAKKRVTIYVLYPPFSHISLLGNRLTCHVEGNPQPATSWVLPDGNVVKNSSLYLSQSENESGRYSCRGRSSIKPDSLEILHVQRARDLPVLFRTVEKLDTSLPITAAGYRLTCSAEIQATENIGSITFEWSKNSDPIDPMMYEVTSQLSTGVTSSRFSTLTSTLRFTNVVQSRDDALFRCRLVNRSAASAFVTAIERWVNISVDYPPSQVKVIGNPEDLVVLEGSSLTLRCSSNAKPISTNEWYFNDLKIAVGNTIAIQGILREEAGIYRCLAYNYVPGSAFATAEVKVVYPPSDAVITKSGERLFCRSIRGSVPPPIYSWIYPNSSYLKGNISEIKLLKESVFGQLRYTCVVSNNLGVSVNATFLQVPSASDQIGSLSVAAFVAVLVVCCLIGIITVIAAVWLLSLKRKRSKNTPAEKGVSKQYLHFIDPFKASETSSNNSSESSLTTNTPSKLSDCRTSVKKKLVPGQANPSNKSLFGEENLNLNCSSIAFQPPSSCIRSIAELNTPQSHSTKQYSSFSETDPPSIEITTVESLRSNSNPSCDNASANSSADKSAKDATPPSGSECSGEDTCEMGKDLNQQENSTKPSLSSGTMTLQRDCVTGSGTQTLFSVQYIPQNTLPKNYFSRAQFQLNRANPAGVIASPFDRILFDANWQSSVKSPRGNSNVTAKLDSKPINYSPVMSSCGEISKNEHGEKMKANAKSDQSSESSYESQSRRSSYSGDFVRNGYGVVRYSSLNDRIANESPNRNQNEPVFISKVGRKQQSLV